MKGVFLSQDAHTVRDVHVLPFVLYDMQFSYCNTFTLVTEATQDCTTNVLEEVILKQTIDTFEKKNLDDKYSLKFET